MVVTNMLPLKPISNGMTPADFFENYAKQGGILFEGDLDKTDEDHGKIYQSGPTGMKLGITFKNKDKRDTFLKATAPDKLGIYEKLCTLANPGTTLGTNNFLRFGKFDPTHGANKKRGNATNNNGKVNDTRVTKKHKGRD